MTAVAIIPARGGSKGVPGKNLRPVGGVPLVVRAVRSALASHRIDEAWVSTDDTEIARIAAEHGARVVRRPNELAGDHATSESALLHALDAMQEAGTDPSVMVFVQCTSPFIRPVDLDRAVDLIITGEADTAFAAVETYEFLWRRDPSGRVIGQNHDAAHRPRRQDREPDYRETGAFYALSVPGFRTHRHRFFGRTAVVEVPESTALEIDTAEELALAGHLAPLLTEHPGPVLTELAPPVDEWALGVDAVITDFDGVHTPDTAYVDETGRESVRVSRSDGLGVGLLRRAAVPFLILSKERNPVVTARAAKLGVEVLQGVDDKETAVRGWIAEHGLDPARVAYVGNDINDLPALGVVGWPVAVPESHPDVLARARIVLTRRGGEGAVRELCERVLAARTAEPVEPVDAARA
ncbi:MAG: cytidylyltransferase domain-containing protein [Propionibacteriaceae bacterium]